MKTGFHEQSLYQILRFSRIIIIAYYHVFHGNSFGKQPSDGKWHGLESDGAGLDLRSPASHLHDFGQVSFLDGHSSSVKWV